MKKVIVTGAAGFVGSNLVMALQNRFPSLSITALDDLSTGRVSYLSGFRGDFWYYPYANIPRNFDLDFDFVFHLSSLTDTRNTDQREMMRENVEGFRLFLSRLSKHTKVIYASSASVYGLKNAVNTEFDILAPANPYAFSKQQLENLANTQAVKRFFGVRFFNVIGPNESHKIGYSSMIHQLTIQAIKNGEVNLFKAGNGGYGLLLDGEQKRDFVHVNDVVELLIKLMDYRGSARVFNCGSGIARSFNSIVKLIEIVLNKDIKINYIDNPYAAGFQNFTCADMSYAKQELDFVPSQSGEQGIKDYIKHIVSHQ